MQTSRMRRWALGGACLGVLLGAVGCGGPESPTADESGGFPYRELAITASAAGIDPNGLGALPGGPNGLGRPANGGSANGVGATASRGPAAQAGGADQEGEGSGNGTSGEGTGFFSGSGDANGESGSGSSGGGSSGASGGGIPNGIGSVGSEPSGVGAAPGASGGGFAGGTVDCTLWCSFVFDCVDQLGGVPDPQDRASCDSECAAAGGQIPSDLSEAEQATIGCILTAFNEGACQSLVTCLRSSTPVDDDGGDNVDTGGGDTGGDTPTEPEQPSGATCAQACQVIAECSGASVGDCVAQCEPVAAQIDLQCFVSATDCTDLSACGN